MIASILSDEENTIVKQITLGLGDSISFWNVALRDLGGPEFQWPDGSTCHNFDHPTGVYDCVDWDPSSSSSDPYFDYDCSFSLDNTICQVNTRACAKPTVTLTTVESFVTIDGAGDIIATPTLASHAGVWPQTVTLTMGSGINAIVKVINFTLTVIDPCLSSVIVATPLGPLAYTLDNIVGGTA